MGLPAGRLGILGRNWGLLSDVMTCIKAQFQTQNNIPISSPVVTWIVEEGGGGLDLIEVERVVARHRAVQS